MEYSSQINYNEHFQKVFTYIQNQTMSVDEAREYLSQKGIDNNEATDLISDIEDKITREKRKEANKDILWGAIWCFGGLICTFSNVGFIFWGAIIFGGIKLIKGIVNSSEL